MFDIRVREVATVVVVEVVGNFAPETPQDSPFLQQVKSKLAEGKRDFIINCGGISWMNSVGVGMLINAIGSVRKAGGEVRVCDVGTRVRRSLQVTSLHDVLSLDFSLGCEELLKELRGDS